MKGPTLWLNCWPSALSKYPPEVTFATLPASAPDRDLTYRVTAEVALLLRPPWTGYPSRSSKPHSHQLSAVFSWMDPVRVCLSPDSLTKSAFPTPGHSISGPVSMVSTTGGGSRRRPSFWGIGQCVRTGFSATQTTKSLLLSSRCSVCGTGISVVRAQNLDCG